MTTEMTNAAPPVARPTSTGRKGAMIRTWVALGILALGVAAVQYAPTFFNANFEKIPAPLPNPRGLAGLPRSFPVPGKSGVIFSTPTEVDQKLTPEITEALGATDYLLRDYAERGIPGDPVIALNLNFYAKGDATPHVPDVCWVGAGMVQAKDGFFTIPHVRHKDGTYSDLEMTLLSFFPRNTNQTEDFVNEQPKGTDGFVNVAYVFLVNGHYVANRLQVKRAFWQPGSKYAYHCKIETTVREICSRAQAQAVVTDYMRASLADIERVLPDWNELNHKTAAPSPTVPAALQ